MLLFSLSTILKSPQVAVNGEVNSCDNSLFLSVEVRVCIEVHGKMILEISTNIYVDCGLSSCIKNKDKKVNIFDVWFRALIKQKIGYSDVN